MSQHSIEPTHEPLATQLDKAASYFPYPPTPDIVSNVRQQLAIKPTQSLVPVRRLAWGATLALFLIILLFAIPPVRAAVLEVLRLGAVRIFLTEPTPTTAPLPAVVSPEAPPSATLRPSPTPLASIQDLAGQTTLAEAQVRIDFPIRLPTYPLDLAAPDQVFLQSLAGPVVILLWFDPDQPDRGRLSLHQLGSSAIVEKIQPRVIRQTSVHGQPALWAEGPYIFQTRSGEYDIRRLIEGKVLIWTEGEITYRLESDLSLEEAIQIAESLQ